MPGPRAAQNLQMPLPRDWKGGQMPRSSRGGGGRRLGAAGIDWYITITRSLSSQAEQTPYWLRVCDDDLNGLKQNWMQGW